jgi:hypothetical protein
MQEKVERFRAALASQKGAIWEQANNGKMWWRADEDTPPCVGQAPNHNAEKYCISDICLWDLQQIRKKEGLSFTLRCPRCNSDKLLSKGYTKGRRIIALDRCYYLISKRYSLFVFVTTI